MNRLRQTLKVRPGEGRMVALAVGLMLSTAAGFAVGQSGIDALFFSRYGVRNLPVMYLVLGPLMFATSLALTGLLGRVTRQRLFTTAPLAVAAVLVGERGIAAAGPRWIYPVLWLTVGLAQLAQGLFTWGLAGIVADTRQAKRLFPLFGAGGILGSVIGGIVTRPLADGLGAENLLLVWGVFLATAFVIGRSLVGGQQKAPPAGGRRSRRPRARLLDEMQEGYRFVRRSGLMKWMAVSAMLFSVLFYSLYLPFSRAATDRFPNEDALAGFFGLFFAITTGTALLFSLLLTNRLFARFGVATMILVLPLIYLVGFGVLVVNTAFATLVTFRFGQMLWAQAVAGPAWETVINVVPAARRDQTRAFLNGGPTQAGTVIAGLVLLIGRRALGPTQLYLIGLAAAALTTFAAWRIRNSYGSALVDALRDGRPRIFSVDPDEEPFGGFQRDAAAVTAAVAGASDPDVRVRRVAAEILGDLHTREAADALIAALGDTDPDVRAMSLRSLATSGAESASPRVALSLDDPEAEVRLEAVRALPRLLDDPHAVAAEIGRRLDDPDPATRAAAAGTILQATGDPAALATLRAMMASDDPDPRALAMRALGSSGRPEVFDLVDSGLGDPIAAVRAATAPALVEADPGRAVASLVRAFGDDESSVREAAAGAIGLIGTVAVGPVLSALFHPATASGALLALEKLPADWDHAAILGYAREEATRAVADHELSRTIDPNGDEGILLLRDSLEDRARRRALNALRAASLLGDRASLRFAIDNLGSGDPGQVANALEALDSAGEADVVRPLLRLFEASAPAPSPREAWLPRLLHDPDPWIHECVEFVTMSSREGAPMTETLTTLSLMERVLFLRKVPLFADLSPADLKRVAAIGGERAYVDGETIAGQGEPGDETHIVVSGEVLVLRAIGREREVEVARRTPGEVVGEMAIITREPRIASLVASGDVRTFRIGRKEFEGILRERPDTALAVMRVLSQRLAESAPATPGA